MDATVPLIVDLDGTLIKTDVLHEMLVQIVCKKPWLLPVLPFWLLGGKHHFKNKMAELVSINPELLPCNPDFHRFLLDERSKGRSLYLATATTHSQATIIAEYFDMFDDIFATKESNLIGDQKARILCEHFGEKGFDYAGNSVADLPVWECARKQILVNPTRKTYREVGQRFDNFSVYDLKHHHFDSYFKALRPHQWTKNLLIFIPLLMSHRLADSTALIATILAFLSFCMVASGIYLLNDLFDLGYDRRHPYKQHRPLASGHMPVIHGLILAPILVGGGLAVGLYLSTDYALLILAYLLATTLYSAWLKSVAVADVLILASFYTLRLFAGSVVADILISSWLLIFSLFLFVSLASMKRYGEIMSLGLDHEELIAGRSYGNRDLPFLQSFGVGCGLIAVLVFVFYVSSPDVDVLYPSADYLWFGTPVLLYWIMHMWREVYYDRMHEDPIIFVLSDRASLVSLLLMIIVFVIGLIS